MLCPSLQNVPDFTRQSQCAVSGESLPQRYETNRKKLRPGVLFSDFQRLFVLFAIRPDGSHPVYGPKPPDKSRKGHTLYTETAPRTNRSRNTPYPSLREPKNRDVKGRHGSGIVHAGGKEWTICFGPCTCLHTCRCRQINDP